MSLQNYENTFEVLIDGKNKTALQFSNIKRKEINSWKKKKCTLC